MLDLSPYRRTAICRPRSSSSASFDAQDVKFVIAFRHKNFTLGASFQSSGFGSVMYDVSVLEIALLS